MTSDWSTTMLVPTGALGAGVSSSPIERGIALVGADPSMVKVISVDSLNVIKVSHPRPQPQGWQGERDMHGGRQYVSLLELEPGNGPA